MIISEKQITQLMNLCIEYRALLVLIESQERKQVYILDLIEEIQKQTEELKVIE